MQQLRDSHRPCLPPAVDAMMTPSGHLKSALDELQEATRLYGGFCDSEDLHLVEDANQHLEQAVSYAYQAYEALTGQSARGPGADDVNGAYAGCYSDVLLGLVDVLADVGSASDAGSPTVFCTSQIDWAARLSELKAQHGFCTLPTDPCLLAARASFDKCLEEIGVAVHYYGEACEKDDTSLLDEGHRHFLEGLRYAEECGDAIRGCSQD